DFVTDILTNVTPLLVQALRGTKDFSQPNALTLDIKPPTNIKGDPKAWWNDVFSVVSDALPVVVTQIPVFTQEKSFGSWVEGAYHSVTSTAEGVIHAAGSAIESVAHATENAVGDVVQAIREIFNDPDCIFCKANPLWWEGVAALHAARAAGAVDNMDQCLSYARQGTEIAAKFQIGDIGDRMTECACRAVFRATAANSQGTGLSATSTLSAANPGGRVHVAAALENQPFGPWEEVQSSMMTDCAVTAVAFEDGLFVYAKGRDDSRIYQTSAQQGEPFVSWSEVQGDGI